ncbi:MAG TPA: hypothetical protein VND62_06305 [Acidimicrobiales bacterium]|nr:hypothetical protein [Acidimicrobiales bacterium]
MPSGTTEPITLRNDGSGAGGVWGRLSQTFLRPPPPKAAEPARIDFSRMTDDEKRARIVGVDATERKVGTIASILAFVIALASYVPYMVSKRTVTLTTTKPTGTTCSPVVGVTNLHYVASTKTCDGIYPASHYVLPLVVVLVLAAAIYVTVRIRRRAPLAFTMVMTGLALGSFIYLVPFGVAGGWVMLRAWRTQKYGSPTAKSRMTGWAAPPRGTTRRAKASTPRSAKAKGAAAATSRKPPSANKRYTPKSPPKKKVTPPAS